MSVLVQHYLGIAIGTIVLFGFLITKAPIFLALVAAIWIYYATLRCPQCRSLAKRNRKKWWRLPARTCLNCGRELTMP
jgi:hypothetical protein